MDKLTDTGFTYTVDYTVPQYSPYYLCGEYKAEHFLDETNIEQHIEDFYCGMYYHFQTAQFYAQLKAEPIIVPEVNNRREILGVRFHEAHASLSVKYLDYSSCEIAINEFINIVKPYLYSYFSDIFDKNTYVVNIKKPDYQKPEYIKFYDAEIQYVKLFGDMTCDINYADPISISIKASNEGEVSVIIKKKI